MNSGDPSTIVLMQAQQLSYAICGDAKHDLVNRMRARLLARQGFSGRHGRTPSVDLLPLYDEVAPS